MTTSVDAFDNQLREIKDLERTLTETQRQREAAAGRNDLVRELPDQSPPRVADFLLYVGAKQSLASTSLLARGLSSGTAFFATVLSGGLFAKSGKQVMAESTRATSEQRETWQKFVAVYDARYGPISLATIATAKGSAKVEDVLVEMVKCDELLASTQASKVELETQLGRTVAQTLGLEPGDDPAQLARDPDRVASARTALQDAESQRFFGAPGGRDAGKDLGDSDISR